MYKYILPACVSLHHVYVVPKLAKRGLLLLMVVSQPVGARIEPWSSGRPASALYC